MKPSFEINASILDVIEIMNLLNLSSTEMGDYKKMEKLKYIAEFTKGIVNKDRFFSRLPKAIVPGTDKLSFFYEYCQHRSSFEKAVSSKKELESQWLLTGEEGLLGDIDAMDMEIRDIESVIDVYEN